MKSEKHRCFGFYFPKALIQLKIPHFVGFAAYFCIIYSILSIFGLFLAEIERLLLYNERWLCFCFSIIYNYLWVILCDIGQYCAILCVTQLFLLITHLFSQISVGHGNALLGCNVAAGPLQRCSLGIFCHEMCCCAHILWHIRDVTP